MTKLSLFFQYACNYFILTFIIFFLENEAVST